jgi:hypothetical protein
LMELRFLESVMLSVKLASITGRSVLRGRHNVLNLSNLKARGLSFKVRKTIGSEPQLRRTGYE